jgi:hypothetical protein
MEEELPIADKRQLTGPSMCPFRSNVINKIFPLSLRLDVY